MRRGREHAVGAHRAPDLGVRTLGPDDEGDEREHARDERRGEEGRDELARSFGGDPRRMPQRMGLGAPAVSALLYRAKQALRAAYAEQVGDDA